MVELRHLRYFIAVAEELHFGRAARRLHMAQPPLSHQIQALERELKAALFLRTKRSVALTEAGRVLLEEARVILRRVAEAERLVQEAASGTIGVLRAGFVLSASYSLLPFAIRDFRSRYPGVELTLREVSPSEQVRRLTSGEIDVGILRLPIDCPGLESVPVFDEALVAALPSGHPLAEKGSLPLQALAREPFILFPRRHGPGLFDVIQEACREAGFSPRVVEEPGEMSSILAFVAGGLGVSLVPESLAGHLADRITYRMLEASRTCTQLAAVFSPQRASPTVRNFCQSLQAAGRECRERVDSLLGPP